MVLIKNENDYPTIKKQLEKMNLISQLLLFKNAAKYIDKPGVLSNILRGMSAKCNRDLYRLLQAQKIVHANTMAVGIDVVY